MKLRANDQIAVSAVQPDALRPGQEFEIGDAAGEELLKRHPEKFTRLSANPVRKPPAPRKPKAARKAAPKAANKAEAPPLNKADPATESKAEG